MNQLFLLQLIADLIKNDKPTVEEVRCARTIVENLIKGASGQYESTIVVPSNSMLDDEAEQARKELL